MDHKDPSSAWSELMGDQLMIKHRKEEPTIPEIHAQDVVTIDVTGRFASSQDDFDGPIFQQVENWTIVIGERDVVNAVEMGVRFMRHTEAFVYSHSKFALGPGTRIHNGYELPPNANVMYEIRVRGVLENANDDAVLLQICHTKKAIANDIFRNERIQVHEFAKQRALQLYKRAITVLESSLQKPQDEQLRPQITECLLDCRNNIAALYLTCKQYHEAKEACIEVLKLDPKNGKALLRAAKACMYDPSSSFVEAKAAIQAAEDACVDQGELVSTIRSLKQDLKKRQALHKRKKQRMVSKMAKGTLTADPTTDRPQELETTAIGNEEKGNQTQVFAAVFALGILISILVPLLISNLGFNKNLA